MPLVIALMAKTRVLTDSDSELRRKFLALRSRSDVAALLQVTEQDLIYLLYRPRPRYRVFKMPKRAGGKREISSPVGSLGILQRKLNQVLQAVYRPRRAAHGFARGRSIRTNAAVHAGRRVILNLDLEDFFPTIHFGRVRGMLEAPPYGLPRAAAQVLAQICTADRVLRQGAPTSPVVSNMICAKLDSELGRLAQGGRCFYTRYADDITFSTSRSVFPNSLCLNPAIHAATGSSSKQ